MKKNIIFLMIALAGFMFVGVQSATAQWSVDVTVYDDSCSCSNITTKIVSWEITKIPGNTLFSSGSTTYPVATQNPTISGSEIIDPDAEDYFKVCVNVRYYNGTTLCCEGTRCKNFNSADLYYGPAVIEVNMH